MKLKKLFAGVVAVAMMATMAFPAFAADINADSSVGQAAPGGTLNIAKTYTENHGSFNSESVNLELVPFGEGDYVHVTKSSETDANAERMLPTFTADADADATNGGSIVMNVPSYTKVGVYTYQVKETDGGTLGMTYDPKTYTLQVIVGNKMEGGQIVANGEKVCYVTMLDGTTKQNSVKNTYTAGTLNITKTVQGNMGDRSTDTKFDFVATFKVPAGKTLRSDIVLPEDYNITWNSDKTVGTVEFKLSHNETFSVQNLPKDIQYSVVEKNGETALANNAYITNAAGENTYQVSYDNFVNGTVGTTEMTDENVIATNITNTWGSTIDTGVILDNAPYILMLAVVAGGAMMLVIKKRREEE